MNSSRGVQRQSPKDRRGNFQCSYSLDKGALRPAAAAAPTTSATVTADGVVSSWGLTTGQVLFNPKRVMLFLWLAGMSHMNGHWLINATGFFWTERHV